MASKMPAAVNLTSSAYTKARLFKGGILDISASYFVLQYHLFKQFWNKAPRAHYVNHLQRS